MTEEQKLKEALKKWNDPPEGLPYLDELDAIKKAAKERLEQMQGVDLDGLKRESSDWYWVSCDKEDTVSAVLVKFLDYLAPYLCRKGYVVVPEEPTRLMVVEGLTEFMPYGTPHEVVTAIFKAMIKTIQKEIGDE